jgi:hypothetical protein
MILKLHGHIGSTASALVDGQLSAEEEERAWQHVLGCAGCRRLVEREGWVKQRLAGLNHPVATPLPADLTDTLTGLGSASASWARVGEIERRSHRRRAVGAVVGAGSVGVAALAMVALTTPPARSPEIPSSQSPAMISPDVVRSTLERSGLLPAADVTMRNGAAR